MTVQVIAQSTITCPSCGTSKTETMPTDACQFFYDCTGCGTLLRPKPGDCCVFCSFGTVPCPPIQEAREKGVCRGADVIRRAAATTQITTPRRPLRRSRQ
ncbi:MAG TPA: GDCCVxC domain-containing (seleno)protein [Pseudolabrys sp.]